MAQEIDLLRKKRTVGSDVQRVSWHLQKKACVHLVGFASARFRIPALAGCTPIRKVTRNGTRRGGRTDAREALDTCPLIRALRAASGKEGGAFNLRLAGIISYYLFLVKRDGDGALRPRPREARSLQSLEREALSLLFCC